ncbi:MAG: bifunctional DNA primase/polymerase [Candidatus Nanopelagicales bacterium]
MDIAVNVARPYAAGAIALWNQGWAPIPLPEQAKRMELRGWTGRDGATPTLDNIIDWVRTNAAGNIAIRLPRNVVGIDVDAYGNKVGAVTFLGLIADLGPLPATTKITSRDDDYSGIRLYRLPDGVDESQFRGGWACVDVIRFGHRYVVAPPSIHPDTGATYRAIDEASGVTRVGLPHVDELPELPDTWCQALQKEQRPTTATSSVPSPRTRSRDLCPAMSNALDRALKDLAGGGGRHDAATKHVLVLARLDEQGHSGGIDALEQFGADFRAAITPDRTGRGAEAQREWESMLTTAIQKIRNAPTPEADKGCCGAVALGQSSVTAQLAGIIPESHLPGQVTGVVDISEQNHQERPPEEQEPAGPSSWTPVNLTPYLDGTWRPPAAGGLYRTDGQGMFYGGLVHSIYGESESGKSWITQIAIANVIKDGGRATLIDFESSPGELAMRFLALGVAPDQLGAQLRYIAPEARPSLEDTAWVDLLNGPQDLVIIDGVTESLVMFGAKTESNDEVTAWFRAFPRLVAERTGAAVILVDHVAKSKDDRGRFAIGAQAKLAAVNGAAYIAEPIDVIAPGKVGHIELRVAKDRPGTIRANSGERRADRTQHAATIRIDSTVDGVTTTQVMTPDEGASVAHSARDSWRPTGLMERISKHLEASGATSGNALRKEMGGKVAHVDQALQALVDEGFVARHKGPRGAVMHQVLAEYREINDVVGEGQTTSTHLDPTSTRSKSEPVETTSTHLDPTSTRSRSETGQDDFDPADGESPLRGSPDGSRSVGAENGDEEPTSTLPQTPSKPSTSTRGRKKQKCGGCDINLDPVLAERGYHYGCEPEGHEEPSGDGR